MLSIMVVFTGDELVSSGLHLLLKLSSTPAFHSCSTAPGPVVSDSC